MAHRLATTEQSVAASWTRSIVCAGCIVGPRLPFPPLYHVGGGIASAADIHCSREFSWSSEKRNRVWSEKCPVSASEANSFDEGGSFHGGNCTPFTAEALYKMICSAVGSGRCETSCEGRWALALGVGDVDVAEEDAARGATGLGEAAEEDGFGDNDDDDGDHEGFFLIRSASEMKPLAWDLRFAFSFLVVATLRALMQSSAASIASFRASSLSGDWAMRLCTSVSWA